MVHTRLSTVLIGCATALVVCILVKNFTLELPKYRDRAKERRGDQNPNYELTEFTAFHVVTPPGNVDLLLLMLRSYLLRRASTLETVQIIIVAIIASTVFLRSNIHIRYEDDGYIYVGALLFGMIVNMFNGYSEPSLTIQRLPMSYKHRDNLFFPPWAFTLPNVLLKVPIIVFESVVWTATTYYTIGFAPEASRLIAGVCRKMVIAHTGGSLTLLLVFLLGGFILPKGSIPNWWRSGFWISLFSYGFNALTVNEMFAVCKFLDTSQTIGK